MDEPAGEVTSSDALSALVEAELRIRRDVEAAEAEAADAVERVRAELDDALRQREGDLEQAERALREEIERDGRTALEEIERTAAERAASYARLDEASVRSHACWLARRVARGEADT